MASSVAASSVARDQKLLLFRVCVEEDAIQAVSDVLRSGWIGEGEQSKEFERLLANYTGNRNVLSLNSCTSAIVLALRLAGAGPGKEVITTPMTCTATNHAILQTGASIVWADIQPQTGNIDPASVRARVTEKTCAVVAVHWAGLPCDLEALNQVAGETGIRVVEDAAHALGSEYHGRPIGNHSDFVCFSFQAIKTITTADGGAIFCKNHDDYERGRLLRWFGIDRGKALGEYDIEEFGYKFHMNDVCAAMGISGMRHLERYLSIRREQASLYTRLLTGVPGLELIREPADVRSAYWLFTMLVERRADFIRCLAEHEIAASPVHLRNDGYTVFLPFKNGSLPGVDYFGERHVSIPIGPWLHEEQVRYIAEVIRRGW